MTPPPPAPIRITVKPDDAALLAALDEYTSHPSFKRQAGVRVPWAWHWVVPGCLAGGALCAWFLRLQWSGSLTATIAGGLAGLALVILFQFYRTSRHPARIREAQRRAIAAFMQDQRRDRLRRIDMADDGVTLHHAEFYIGFPWTSIRRARATAGALLIESWNGGLYIAPAASFTSRDALEAAAAYARERLAHAGTAEADVIRRHLADHDAACLECKYALRGAAGETCPECGVLLRAEQFGLRGGSHISEPSPRSTSP